MNKYIKFLLVPMIVFGINSDSGFCMIQQNNDVNNRINDVIGNLSIEIHDNGTFRENATDPYSYNTTREYLIQFLNHVKKLWQFNLPEDARISLTSYINALLSDILQYRDGDELVSNCSVFVNTFIENLDLLVDNLNDNTKLLLKDVLQQLHETSKCFFIGTNSLNDSSIEYNPEENTDNLVDQVDQNEENIDNLIDQFESINI